MRLAPQWGGGGWRRDGGIDGRRRGLGVRGWGGRGEGLRRARAGAARLLPGARGGSYRLSGPAAGVAGASPTELTPSAGARPFGPGPG